MNYSAPIRTITFEKSEAEKPEKAKAPETVLIPAALLLAAEIASPKRDDERPYLESLYLHATPEGVGRVVGGDGMRCFIGSFPLPPEGVPEWLTAGVIVSNKDLRARINMLANLGDKTVRITSRKGSSKVEFADPGRSIAMQVAVVRGTYPAYEERLAKTQNFGDLDNDGNAKATEWQAIGINSRYLKSVGDIAKQLEAGMEKSRRQEGGMVVRAFTGGGPLAPVLFDFGGWPGCVMMMGVAPARSAISGPSAAILGRAAKLTIAALNAHATRWRVRAEETDNEDEKAQCAYREGGFRERVAAILAVIPEKGTLIAPEPEADPDPDPEPDPDSWFDGDAEPEPEPEPDPAPEPEPAPGPTITRTKIRTKRA